jgi:hypothetical protein
LQAVAGFSTNGSNEEGIDGVVPFINKLLAENIIARVPKQGGRGARAADKHLYTAREGGELVYPTSGRRSKRLPAGCSVRERIRAPGSPVFRADVLFSPLSSLLSLSFILD